MAAMSYSEYGQTQHTRGNEEDQKKKKKRKKQYSNEVLQRRLQRNGGSY